LPHKWPFSWISCGTYAPGPVVRAGLGVYKNLIEWTIINLKIKKMATKEKPIPVQKSPGPGGVYGNMTWWEFTLLQIKLKSKLK